MFLWHDPALSHISSRACCQLCYKQHFCLLQWNRLGAGWPWIARLTGKGYFQDSGKSHSCLQNAIKESQSNTSDNVPFLRREEENKRDEQIIPLLLNYQHFQEECEQDSCPAFLIRVLPRSSLWQLLIFRQTETSSFLLALANKAKKLTCYRTGDRTGMNCEWVYGWVIQRKKPPPIFVW